MDVISHFWTLGHWQIDLLTIGLLLTSAVITLVPEELVFLILGSLAHFGRVSPMEALVAAQLGLIPADALTVCFGRLLGSQVLSRGPFSRLLEQDALQRTLGRLQRSSGRVLFCARFLPMLRAPIYLAAGVGRVSLRRAILIDTIAASVQISAYFILGFVFGDQILHLVPVITYAIPGVAILLFLAHFLKSRPAFQRRPADTLAA